MSARGRSRYSRSRSRSPRYGRRDSRSRSKSYSPKRGGGSSRRKSYSRSPMSARRRHVGSREKPEEGTCLGVFGLSLYTTERELDKEFSKFGPLQKVQVVLDGKVRIVNVLEKIVIKTLILPSTSLNNLNILNFRPVEAVALLLCILSRWTMQELPRMQCVTQKSMEDEFVLIIQ